MIIKTFGLYLIYKEKKLVLRLTNGNCTPPEGG